MTAKLKEKAIKPKATGPKGVKPRAKSIKPKAIKKSALTIVVDSLDDDKAEEVVTIDLTGRSTLTDHIVVATGRSTRQVGAMAEHLVEKLKQSGLKVSIEGMGQMDWVLIDAGDIVCHLFRPEVRAFYNIEKMWIERAQEPVTDAISA